MSDFTPSQQDTFESWKAFSADVMSRVNSSILMIILERRGFDLSQAKVNGSGQISGINCVLHQGSDSRSFAVTNEGAYICSTRCGSGNILSLMNGGSQPRGQDYKDALLELADLTGVDTSWMRGDCQPRPFQGAKKPRAQTPVKSDPIRHLKELEPCLGQITIPALELLKKRIPGLLTEDYDGIVDDGWIGSPASATDKKDPRGAYHIGGRGHQLMLPMRSLEDPSKISAASYRWTRSGEAPKGKNILLHHGASGGQFGSVFGDINQALRGAKVIGHLVISEGDVDTLTLTAMGVQYHIGVAGCGRLTKVIKFLMSIGWTGKVIACMDNDKHDAGKKAIERAYKIAKGSGIELYDGRSSNPGQDLNDVFNELGGCDGARAVISLIESAPHCKVSFPPEPVEVSSGMLSQLSKVSSKLSKNHEQELKDLARKDKNDRRSAFKSFSGLSFHMHEIFQYSEKALTSFVRLLLLEGLSDLLPGQVEKILREALPENGSPERILTEAKSSPIDKDSYYPAAASSRYILKSLPGTLYHRTITELAKATNRQAVLLLEWFDVFRSTHRSDKSYVTYAGTVEEGPYQKKLSGLRWCGALQTDVTVNDPRREDHGTFMRGHRTTCGSAQCAFCQGIYCASQANYLRAMSSWSSSMLVAELIADDDDPETVSKIWTETALKLRTSQVRGVMRPTLKDMGVRAGVLFFAQNTSANRSAFSRVFGRFAFRKMTGAEALDLFSLSCSLVALRISAKIIQRDVDFQSDSWLGEIKIARKRGKCHDFPWLSLGAWKLHRNNLEEADNKPLDDREGLQTSYHADSKVIIHEQSTQFKPLHHHELVKIAGKNEELNRWLDDSFRADLGSHMAYALISRRRQIRENREKYAQSIEGSNPKNL